MALAKERIRQNLPPAFSQGLDPSSLESFGSEGHLPTTTPFYPISSSSTFGFVNSLPQEWAYSSHSSSVLSFEQPKIDQEEECALWIDTMDREYQPSCVNSRLGRNANCFEMASGYTEERFGLMYPSSTAMDGFEDGGEIERSGSQKRPYMVHYS